MTQLAAQKEAPLSKEEREQFEYYSTQIQQCVRRGREARTEMIEYVLSILNSDPPLWREHYASKEDYIRTELNIEKSSFDRMKKDNRNFLYLVGNTDDPDEQITLNRMSDYSYRELRNLAINNEPILKKGGETDEEYRERLEIKDREDVVLIQDLWNQIYPRIVRFKRESNTGIYPNGGYAVTAGDIRGTCLVLQQVMEVPRQLNEGVDPKDIAVSNLEGRGISLQDVMDTGGEYATEVIDAVTQLGISEALIENKMRQNVHIRDNLEKRYSYDQYEGKLIYEDGTLKIVNKHNVYDLLREWSDLLGRDTSISVRRTLKDE